MAKTRKTNTYKIKVEYDVDAAETKVYACSTYQDSATTMPDYESKYIEITTLSAGEDTDLAGIISTCLTQCDSDEGV